MDEQWIKVDQYNQVRSDKYKDRYSILLGSSGQNDVVYPKYCAPQVWKDGKKLVLTKDGQTVFIPLSISLGNDKAKALEILKALINQVEKL